MKHLAECTWCVSLLKNIKKYKNHKFGYTNGAMWIDVETTEEVNLIEQLNGHQEATYKIYNELLK